MPSAEDSLDCWLDYIGSTHPSEIEMGLERVKEVFARLSLDGKPGKTVVVAGTNGKGSTIAMADQGLRTLGFSVGTYTSPHILRFNERVKINGLDVSDEQLVKAFCIVEEARKNVKLTYFEYSTLAALYLLFNASLDVVLLEIGLGGRLDAVNIVDADISVITSVDLDHVEWLGSDISKIGLEKAGILRECKPFIGGFDLPESVHEQAQALQCDRYVFGRDFFTCDKGLHIQFARSGIKGIAPQTNLPISNVLVAIQLIVLLYNDIKERQISSREFEVVLHAIETLGVEGRLERIANLPIYLDVGHNPHAARFLAEFVKQKKDSGVSVDAVYSALGDKDISSVVEILSPYIENWCIAPLDSERAIDVLLLLETVSRFAQNVETFDSVGAAMNEWLLGQQSNGSVNNAISEEITQETGRLLLVFGSFYTIEAAKKYLNNNV